MFCCCFGNNERSTQDDYISTPLLRHEQNGTLLPKNAKELNEGSTAIIFQVTVNSTDFAAKSPKKSPNSNLQQKINENFTNERKTIAEIRKKCGGNANILEFISKHGIGNPISDAIYSELCQRDLQQQIIFLLENQTAGEKKGLDLGYILGCCSQINNGVSALHEAGIAHRDLKLENIFVTENGVLKIADFGASMRNAEKNKASDFVGTATYMAPEIFRTEMQSVKNKKYLPIPTDIWAMGLIFCELYAESSETTISQTAENILSSIRGFAHREKEPTDQAILLNMYQINQKQDSKYPCTITPKVLSSAENIFPSIMPCLFMRADLRGYEQPTEEQKYTLLSYSIF